MSIAGILAEIYAMVGIMPFYMVIVSKQISSLKVDPAASSQTSGGTCT